jgi:endonuclease YncB( thermonuclease family)
MGNIFTKKSFKNVNKDVFKTYSLEGLSTYCCILSIYDGDTCTVGFKRKGEFLKTKVRLLGYDSPEIKPRKNIEHRNEEIAAAYRAKDFLDKLTQNKIIWIEFDKNDKYGRPLATLYTEQSYFKLKCLSITWLSITKRVNINEFMVQQGHGYPYEGGRKTKFVTIIM